MAADVEAKTAGEAMRADMLEQPAIICRQAATVPAELRDKLRAAQRSGLPVILTGSGSAYHASLAGSALFCKRGTAAFAVPAAEFTAYAPTRLHGPVIALSQSGASSDVLEAAALARERGAKLAAITNAPRSQLARMADINLDLGAGTERAIPATKTVSAMIAALFVLACGADDARALSRAEPRLTKAVNERPPDFLLQALSAARQVFVLGNGLGYPWALESALKLKEAARMPAEAFSTGEFKHGVTVMVRPQTLTLLYDDVRDGEAAKARQALRRLSSAVIPLSALDRKRTAETQGDVVSMLLALIRMQRIAYEIALRRGFDPDAPPTLRKQVKGWM